MEACRVFPGEFGCGEALCGPGRVTTEKWEVRLPQDSFSGTAQRIARGVRAAPGSSTPFGSGLTM